MGKLKTGSFLMIGGFKFQKPEKESSPVYQTNQAKEKGISL